MENKNSKGVIALLVSLVIILGALCILFATGTINFKNEVDNNSNNLSTDNTTQEATNNNEIDSALLNSLYTILGINAGEDAYWGGDCLNYFLSSNEYKNNAKQIFGLYAAQNRLSTYHYEDGSCNEECKKAYSCAECSSISKINANKITKLYSLDNLKFNELPGFKDEYTYTNGIPAGVCHYKVTHNARGSYIDSNSIRITDSQVATDYVFGDDNKINSTKNQTVTYDFKKDSDGNYYLSQVSVK